MIVKKTESIEERQRRLDERRDSDMRAILNSPEGRRVSWSILEMTGIFRESYVEGDHGYGTTRNEGKRSVGTWFLNWVLNAKPDAFNQMQRENKSEATKDEKIKEKIIEETDILETGA